MILKRILKRLLPDTWWPVLTYNPIVKPFLRFADVPAWLLYSEFRGLPPNPLRIRVGVGGKWFNNQPRYLLQGAQLWLFLFGTSRVQFDSDIIELGCGCGRRAHHLRDFNLNGIRYVGRYIGIDIDDEFLSWCRKNFDMERFTFVKSSQKSAIYQSNEDGSDDSGRFRFPVEEESCMGL